MTRVTRCVTAASFQQPEFILPSTWRSHAPFAFWLIEAHRPQVLVELGTHYGFSYLCFCQQVQALRLDARATAVDTWQGDEHAGWYDERVFNSLQALHDPRYGRFSTLLRSTFDDAVRHFADGSIDLLHIDGRHFYDDVAHDFMAWKPKLSPRGIVVFHDTQETERGFGVGKLWSEVSRGQPHFEFLHGHGLGVLGVGSSPAVANFPLFSDTAASEDRQRIRRAYETLGSHIGATGSFNRNDPCPCGSGRRFKHCHERVDAIEVRQSA